MNSRALVFCAVSTALATFVSSSAEAASLRLRQIGTGTQAAVTSPGGGDIAFARNGTVTVIDRESRRRLYAAPSSCDITAVSRTTVALACNLPTSKDTIFLLERATGTIAPLRLPFPAPRAQITELGARWALVDTVVVAEDGIHGEDRRVLLNIRTAQAVDLSRADPYGPRRYLDLDAEQPTRALCRPITRSRYSNTSQLVLQRRTITRSGRWFLEQDSTGIAELQRCGSRTKRRFSPKQAVLTGDGHVAAIGKGIIGYVSSDRRRPIVLESLASRRRWKARRPTGNTFVLAAAGRHLIVSAQTGGPYTIYRATPTP